MAKEYYECHITIASTVPDDVQKKVKEIGWLFSAIDGDPNLGPGVKCYATRQFPDRIPLVEVERYLREAAQCLKWDGFAIRRLKIERVLLDERLGVSRG